MDVLTQLAGALAGRYDIEREIGRGGMATVYLARDVRHSRHVALKVLDPELGAVLGGERFLSEIRVTANLQHPNLLPLFDSGSANGLLYYVMPFVEGESLRARLDRERQLPVDEAVRIAVTIADALDYAHGHGVIHRDLKPENILLQHGQPVIADFGIALAVSNAGGARITQTGLSLGTPQYMSPEQATGDRVIDGRSDIYSLGAILYELLIGDPPHAASTSQAVIAKILTEEPRAISSIRASVPDHVSEAVAVALEKLPADRFAMAREFSDALSRRGTVRPRRQAGAAFDAARATRAVRARPIALILQIVPWAFAALAVAVAWNAMGRVPITQQPAVFELVYPDSVVPVSAALSAFALTSDGSAMAFPGARAADMQDWQLFVRRLNDRTARVLPGTNQARWPVFVNDGRELLFIRDGKLYRSVIGGGVPTLERDSAAYVAVGDRGTLLLEHDGKLLRVPPGERVGVPIPVDDAMGIMMNAARFAVFLPGERHVLVTIRTRAGGTGEIALIDVASGKMTPLGLPGTQARYSATGHVVFVAPNGSLMAAPFSLRSRRTTGAAKRITTGVVTGPNNSAGYAISGDGTLIALHGAGRDERHLEIVDASGRKTRVSAELQQYGWLSISPDGRRIATEIAATSAGPWDVWIFDLDSRTLSRMTSGGRSFRPGGWTPDGARVVYITGTIGGQLKAVSLPWDGTGVPELLMEHAQPIQTVSVGPAGTWIAATVGRLTPTDIVIAPLDSPRAVRPFVTGPAHETSPRVSPDGNLLAYSSDVSGRTEVYARPLRGSGGRIQVSTNGGTEPVWNMRTGALFYRTNTATMRATFAGAPDRRVASRDSLFPLTGLKAAAGAPFYDAFPDGRRLIALSGEASRVTPVVYLGWPEMLR